jgi:hypothetical protein
VSQLHDGDIFLQLLGNEYISIVTRGNDGEQVDFNPFEHDDMLEPSMFRIFDVVSKILL